MELIGPVFWHEQSGSNQANGSTFTMTHAEYNIVMPRLNALIAQDLIQKTQIHRLEGGCKVLASFGQSNTIHTLLEEFLGGPQK